MLIRQYHSKKSKGKQELKKLIDAMDPIEVQKIIAMIEKEQYSSNKLRLKYKP